MRLRFLSLLPLLVASQGALAGAPELPPPSVQQQVSGTEKLDLPAPYVPSHQVSGTIRIWGHGAYAQAQDFIEGLTRAWEDGFRRRQPRVRFENRLHGTASAIGALYTGTG